MFIANLDFLNSPPQIYFFKKRTNKTLFGGFLFVIYILLMLTILIFYVLNYYVNDKYDVRFSLYKSFIDNDDLINKKDAINSHFNYSFDLLRLQKNLETTELNKQFIIIDSNFSVIERNKFISKIPKDRVLYILYICFFNCTIEEDDVAYILNITYSGYKIEHQNEKIPLETNNEKYLFNKELLFSYNKSSIFRINFELIKYKEEKGLLGIFDNWLNKKNEYSCITIESIDEANTEKAIDLGLGLEFKILSIIHFNTQGNQIVEYIRTKKSALDVFANIGSLFSTFFNLFSFIFQFYSRNYNNYKIMKELLTSPKITNSNIRICRAKTIKFENISKRNKNYMNFDKQSIDTSKSVPFKSNNNNNKNNNKIPKYKEEKLVDNFHLTNINLIYFILKHIKCKTKNMRKKYDIIEICNNILFKYISIETILYNQIIFENLLKDYKWNESYLQKIDNNFLIRKLKSIT